MAPKDPGGASLPLSTAPFPTTGSKVTSVRTTKPYDGANDYVMHFDARQTPPAEAFWSLILYDADYFFVANPLNRYTLSSRSPSKYNPDLDLHIQHNSPGRDREANWLPAPAGKFILILRLYWPRETKLSIITGTWTIRPVKLVPRPSSPTGNG